MSEYTRVKRVVQGHVSSRHRLLDDYQAVVSSDGAWFGVWDLDKSQDFDEAIRNAKAEAWEEGWESGYLYGYLGPLYASDNPYREETQ